MGRAPDASGPGADAPSNAMLLRRANAGKSLARTPLNAPVERMPELLVLPGSHDGERARLGLHAAGMACRVRALAPGWHVAVLRHRAGQPRCRPLAAAGR